MPCLPEELLHQIYMYTDMETCAKMGRYNEAEIMAQKSLDNLGETTFSSTQWLAINLIKKGCNVFLTGAAGSGKSHIIKLLETFTDKKIAITSSTGVSAFLINGSTIHSYFGIGLADKPAKTLVKNLKKENIDELRSVELLVIDEVSMISMELFEKLNIILKAVRLNNKFMGGIQIVISGDFYQLLTPSGNLLLESPTFEKFIKVELKTNYRQQDDNFLSLLSRLRIGDLLKTDIEMLEGRLTKTNLLPSNVFCLFPTNRQVDSFNIQKYKGNKHQEVLYKAKYTGNTTLCKDMKSQFKTKGIDELRLKVGVKVMLLRNMSIIEGYVNGSTGIVMSLSKGVVEVKFDHNNRIFPISAAEWKRGGSEKFVFATATQIPLSLAFASNYHKIQGSTIHVPVYMDLANCFTYHQVYTAVSRVKKIENLHLLSFDPKKITVHQTVKKYYN